MNYSLLFPGQGSQEVGMGKDIYDAFPSARNIFQRVDDALSFDLSETIFHGPDEALKRTALTQPALLAVSIAFLEVLRERMKKPLEPLFLAGHSLGEYTALVAGGTFSLEDGARLVHLRGRLMQEAVPEGEGSMAAILGLEPSAVEDICREGAPSGECQPANFNSPGQVVVSGETAFVNAVMALAKERGAKRVVPLNVSAPFHSRQMRPVADKLLAAFGKCAWKEPSAPIVSNAWARPVSTVEEIQRALFDQTFHPVLWCDSVNEMADRGGDSFLEIGPGTVLSGLVKKCRKGLAVRSLGKLGELDSVLSFLEGGESHD